MDDLIAFFAARLDALEQVAREAADGDSGEWFMGDRWNVYRAEDATRGDEDYQGDEHALVAYGNVKPQSVHIALNDPASVLADIAAKRAFLEDVVKVLGYTSTVTAEGGTLIRMLKRFAGVYSSHPDWKATWAP